MVAAVATCCLATGCAVATAEPADARLSIVATTPILADLATHVVGDRMDVISLVPPGADPHSYELSLRDVRSVVYADVAFSNYLMLEQHSVIKTLDSNLRPGVPNISLAEASTHHGAEVIPLVEHHHLETVWLGWRVSGDGEQRGASRASEVELSVTGVEGPGDLMAYLTGTFGQPEIVANSGDGFDAGDAYARDSLRLPVDAHTHMSWAFTAPGLYRMRVAARLINPGAQPLAIADAEVTFVVGTDPHSLPEFAGRTIVSAGHADITADLDAGALALEADPAGGGERTQRRHSLEDTVIWVPPKALMEIPAAPTFRFLGRPGTQIHQLPQAVLGAHVHGEIDPHLWMNVRNAKAYVNTILETVVAVDPDGTIDYRRNARAYLAELDAVDAYVAERIDSIPPERRHLITTHDAYGYLAAAYGIDIAGFVAPNPAVEPSLVQRRKLAETLRTLDVPAVFLEPTLARESSVLAALATDEDVEICELYSDTLDTRVPTYADLMRFNADSLARCLGGS